ncbi:transposase [Rhodococcus sp. 077-4]|uniref:transposase n=1 Tax=Rhodococcus sp. 077-4 TaxID=2789271 RepID=UPI0039F4D2AE
MRGRPYPAEVRERATRMVTERVPDSPSPWAAIESVASHLGLHPNTVRLWYRQAQGVTDERPLLPSEQNAEIARLRQELADARRLNADLVAGSAESFHHTERTPL